MSSIVLPYDATEVRSRPSFQARYERNLVKTARVGDGRTQQQREVDALVGTIGELVILQHALELGATVIEPHPDHWWEDLVLIINGERWSVDVKTCSSKSVSMTEREAMALKEHPHRTVIYLVLDARIDGQFTILGMVTGNNRTLKQGPWRLSNKNLSYYTWLSDVGSKFDTMNADDYLQLLQDSKDTP